MAMITTKTAAMMLGVTTARIRQLILAKRIPATKFGRDLMINEKDLDKVADRPVGRPRIPKLKIVPASLVTTTVSAVTCPFCKYMNLNADESDLCEHFFKVYPVDGPHQVLFEFLEGPDETR